MHQWKSNSLLQHGCRGSCRSNPSAIHGRAYVVGPSTAGCLYPSLWLMDESATPVAERAATRSRSAPRRRRHSPTTPPAASAHLQALRRRTVRPPPQRGRTNSFRRAPQSTGPASNVAMAYTGASGSILTPQAIICEIGPGTEYAVPRPAQQRAAESDPDPQRRGKTNPERIFQFRMDPVGTTGGNTIPRLRITNPITGTQCRTYFSISRPSAQPPS